MSCAEMMSSFVGFLGRLVLIVMAVAFLFKTIGFMQLSFSLLSTKPGSNADLVDTNLAQSGRFNPYSLSLLMTSVILVALATYCLYVPIFCKRRGVKRLAFISLFAFFSGLIVIACVCPSLAKFGDDTLIGLFASQPMYKWKISQDHGQGVPEADKKATIIWDLMQENLECCGFESPSDWSAFEPRSSEPNTLLPRSCCLNLTEATIKGNGYCRFDLRHWATGCSHQVHRIIGQAISMMRSVTYHSMIFCMLASIITIWASYEERQSWEIIRIGQPYHESLYNDQTNHGLVITEEQTYLYPYLSHTPFHTRYGSQ